MIDFDIVFDKDNGAGLRTIDVAAVLGVSRATISGYKNKRKQPHIFLKERMAAFVRAVEAAVFKGKFPPPPDLDDQALRAYIRRTLKLT